MSKKLKTFFYITAILLGIYFINVLLTDDVQGIKKKVYSLNQPMTNIAHIEFLDSKQAIAFYEWGNHQNKHFGSAFFKKNLFGWGFVGGGTGALSSGYKLDWGFSNLESRFSDYTDLIRGKILDPQIEEVIIKTDSGKEFKANIIEYSNNQKFWFLVTDGEALLGSTISGLSFDGKIIEQITK